MFSSPSCKSSFSICFHSYCIENVTIFPTCILALIIGVNSFCKLKQNPKIFPSKWIYEMIFLSFGIMMSTAGILHCFIHDNPGPNDHLLIKIVRFIFTIVDVGLTSNIAVAFAWSGAADLQWIDPSTKKSKIIIYSSFVLVFVSWILCIWLQAKYGFLLLYMAVIGLCCGFYLITQIISYVQQENIKGWKWFIAGGLFGLLGFASLINPNICKWLYSISAFINPEFLWFLFSDFAENMPWIFVALVLFVLSTLVASYLFYKAWKNRKGISSTLIKSTVFAKRYIRRRKYIEKLEQKQEQLQVIINEDELEAKRKEQRKKRGFIFKEILDTERRYVTDLQVLQDFYMEPIKKIAFSNNSNGTIFKRETYELMFQNLETIIGVNKVFLKELECIEETGIAPMVSLPVKGRSNTVTGATNVNSPDSASKRQKRSSLLAFKDLLNISKKSKPKPTTPPPIPKKPSQFSNNIKSELQAEAASSKEEELAKLLAYFSHSFKLYTDYISNFKNTTILMEQEKKNTEFEKSLKEMRNKIPYTPKPTLDSLLITPIQRLCRYRLLLEELVKNCSYEEHLHRKILKAVDAMKSVASYVNEKERENENIFKMVSLQNRLGNTYTILTPSSKLVKDLEFFLDEEDEEPVACLCSFGSPPTVEVPVDTLFIFTDSIVIELAQLDSSDTVQEEIAYVIPYNILVSIKKEKKDTLEFSFKRNNNLQQIFLNFQLSSANNNNNINQLYEVMGKILNLVTQYKELSTE